MASRSKMSQACIICHKKKVKCDLGAGIQPCTNCRQHEYPCRPHRRKRKRYTLSPSPSPTSSTIPNIHVSPHYQPTSLETLETLESTRRSEPRRNYGSHSFSHPVHGLDPADPDLAVHTQPASNPDQTPGATESFVGRSEYLGCDIPFVEQASESPASPQGRQLSDIDVEVLRLYKSYELPSLSLRSSMIDRYFEFCSPWTPIVERQWLDDTNGKQPSLLLLQAVFLAGSRVSLMPPPYGSSEDFYKRAKALFMCGYESDMIKTIVALCLLQWWNPTGPEQISADTSGFWVRIAVGMAYQIGLHKEPPQGPDRKLRRRLWWTLVSRDNIISVGVGRPRTIHLEDSNVAPPSIFDFPFQDTKSYLFVAFVQITQLLADVTQHRRRKSLKDQQRQNLENALYRWVKELHPDLQLFQTKETGRCLRPYNFEARQLHIYYFVTLIILHGASAKDSPPSNISLIASSFVAGIYEEFLTRDDFRYLGPVFTFHALAAGLSQISGFRYSSLRHVADAELEIIFMSLNELVKRWGSAEGITKALNQARDRILSHGVSDTPFSNIPETSLPFFTDFGPELCRHWHLLRKGPAPNQGRDVAAYQPPFLDRSAVTNRESIISQVDNTLHTSDSAQTESMNTVMNNEISTFGGQGFASYQEWDALDPLGSWLLGDIGLENL